MVNIMGFDTGGIGGALMGWATSMIFWALVILGMCVVAIITLKVKQNRRFEFPCREIIGLGQGKIRMEDSKCGWFKKNRIFFGLIERGGEDEMLVKDGKRRVFYVSSTDYQDINGEKGLIVKRKDDDPSVLVPISKFNLDEKSKQMIMSIAPADYRDVGSQILDERKKETMGFWDENKAAIIGGVIIVFSLVALIIIFRFAQNESEGWRLAGQNMMNSINTLKSNAP